MILSIVAQLAQGDLATLRAALLHASNPRPGLSEYDLNPAARPDDFAAPRRLTPAAVLLPIVLAREPAILFTRRTGHLSRHAGQISFPGGTCEARDVSAATTALRETREETGIDAALVTVAGFLESYETGTGYVIQPVVGVLREGFTLAPDKHEVAEIFQVPLSFILDPANCREETRHLAGRERRFHVFRYGAHEIWGATAAILVDFVGRLRTADEPAHGKPSAAPVKRPHADRS